MLLNDIDNLMIGSTPQDRAYLGDVLIWPQQPVPPHPYDEDYISFTNTAVFPNSVTFLTCDGGLDQIATSISYSKDRVNWTTYEITDEEISIRVSVESGETVYWKGIADAWMLSSYSCGAFFNVSFEEYFEVKGNAMSLLYGDDFIGKKSFRRSYALAGIFRSSVVNAENIILPATALTDYCYYRMFYWSGNLVKAPSLPATTLATGCYSEMFRDCTSLVNVTELPATTLADYCYDRMFQGCSSLTTAPELPATILADHCYYRMFYGCSSLTTAPELPATTLADYCYESMFHGCSSLETAPELPATTLADYCYSYMFQGCSSLTTAPELPATTLADYCYNCMFYGCSSLATAPELLATTLAFYCYTSMFEGCSSLNYIKCIATDISADHSTVNWMTGVPSTGTFVKKAGVSWPKGRNGIPVGWTVMEVD